MRSLRTSGRCGLSIIIPVLDERERINDCLENLASQECDGYCQIIVVDGDPEGSTIRAVRGDRVVCLVSARGRGTQMNVGARAAEGDILLFLHVDTRLPAGALAAVASTLETDGCVGGAFALGIDSRRLFLRCIAALTNLRSRLGRIPYGDQAIFLTRACFETLGGFGEIPIMEDVDLMRRVKKHGGRICILKPKVLTSARRWEAEGLLYATVRNQILRLLFHLGVSPGTLVKFYRVQS